jgi:hypothetical protein
MLRSCRDQRVLAQVCKVDEHATWQHSTAERRRQQQAGDGESSAAKQPRIPVQVSIVGEHAIGHK